MALIHLDFFSKALGMGTQLEVILPENREQKKYPVLYLLHGMTDDHTTWQRNTSIERYAEEKGVAVIMPAGHLGWYTDMKCGLPYYTYVSREVPKVCRRFFSCISRRKEDNFVAGNSMGGYGALKLALLNPDTFGAAASLSGAFDPAATAEMERDQFYPSLWEDIFGPAKGIAGSDNDLFAVAKRLADKGISRPKLYMWCGTEDVLRGQNREMKHYLEKLGYDLTYKESAGDHSWKCWDSQIEDVLNWFPLEEGRRGG